MFDPTLWFRRPDDPVAHFDRVKARAYFWFGVWFWLFGSVAFVVDADFGLLWTAVSAVASGVLFFLWLRQRDIPLEPTLYAALPDRFIQRSRSWFSRSRRGTAVLLIPALLVHPGGMLFLLLALVWAGLSGLMGLNEHLKGLAEARKVASTSFTYLEGSLEARLARLTSDQFEELVAALLKRMGLQVRRGLRHPDLILSDPTPVTGGKMVVHCQHTPSVHEDALRSLYGSVTANGAQKGVLVTSGSFTAGARTWIKGRPIELIEGKRLVELLQAQHAS